MKGWKIQSSEELQATATRLESVTWNSCQDHLGIRIPQGVCTVDVVTIIRRPQGGKESLCPLIQQQYIGDQDFSSALSLEIMCYYRILETKHASKEWKHCWSLTFKVKSADSEVHHVRGL
jgi:hypothetical protein